MVYQAALLDRLAAVLSTRSGQRSSLEIKYAAAHNGHVRSFEFDAAWK